jgi:hypothetical protein
MLTSGVAKSIWLGQNDSVRNTKRDIIWLTYLSTLAIVKTILILIGRRLLR